VQPLPISAERFNGIAKTEIITKPITKIVKSFSDILPPLKFY
jgi:hypothetical protein